MSTRGSSTATATDAQPEPSERRNKRKRDRAQSSDVIAVKNLRRVFGRGKGAQTALDGVSFSLPWREVALVFGPSGCGKSTLLGILGGLDRGYEGQAELFGQDLSRLSDRQLSRLRGERIGFVFQSFHLLGHLDVADNVAAPALFDRAGVSGQQGRDRARAMLERVGLADRATARPSELSGGQRQRVAIARALFREPELLLCDEPTGNLDQTTGEQIIDLFAELHEDLATSIVIVTHEARLRRIAARVLHMLDGSLKRVEMLNAKSEHD